MGRIRTIKPEFFVNEDLYDLEEETGLPIRVAFAGLWCQADREGRFKWKPRTLKATVLPHDEVDFSRVLHALGTRDFVQKYTVNGVDYGVILGFTKHQVVNNKERPSEIPNPPEINELTRETRDSDASSTREVRVTQGREGKGKDIGASEEAPKTPPAKRFKPPTLEQVQTYCDERGNSINPRKFLDHYEANGWMRGKSKIKDWKACVRTWEGNEESGDKPTLELV